MTSTNHVMTGAVIALAVRQPTLAIPFAFISHFVLDAIPHFGIYEDDVIRRNGHWLFRSVISVGIPVMLTLLIIIPHLAANKIAWGIVLASMLAAILPDSIWVYRFFQEIKTRQWRTGGRFARFHQAIQWFEQPAGLIVELAWLLTMLIIFSKLVS